MRGIGAQAALTSHLDWVPRIRNKGAGHRNLITGRIDAIDIHGAVRAIEDTGDVIPLVQIVRISRPGFSPGREGPVKPGAIKNMKTPATKRIVVGGGATEGSPTLVQRPARGRSDSIVAAASDRTGLPNHRDVAVVGCRISPTFHREWFSCRQRHTVVRRRHNHETLIVARKLHRRVAIRGGAGKSTHNVGGDVAGVIGVGECAQSAHVGFNVRLRRLRGFLQRPVRRRIEVQDRVGIGRLRAGWQRPKQEERQAHKGETIQHLFGQHLFVVVGIVGFHGWFCVWSGLKHILNMLSTTKYMIFLILFN